MFFVRQIIRVLALIHSEAATSQLAAGLVLGMFMGFTPMMSLFWVKYVVLALILRVNLGMVFFSLGVFKSLSFGLDPLFDRLGLRLLTGDLHGFWAKLYDLPLVPFTRFNNSIVMGSVACSIVLMIPVFLMTTYLIKHYRILVVSRVRGTTFFKTWQASNFYKLCEKYHAFG